MLAWGTYIPAKAALAQVLLNHAWAETAEHGSRTKPWPWADTWPVARLTINQERFIVLADAGGESLAFGPSHVTGSVLPGEAGTSVISAHRDTQFSVLGELKHGAQITLETASGEVLLYQMRYSFILPEPTLSIADDARDQQLILVTCWPIESVSPAPNERYAVVFERVD